MVNRRMFFGEIEGAVRNNPLCVNLEAAADCAWQYGALGRNAFGKPGTAINRLRNIQASSSASDKNS
ncbi:hypothetical protein CPter91_4728 [Collimonas pratensis]|uniref:Uncharacterized protein n=1 Tax=Collimonas pratensis TaxID=279113 RepID=A0A127QAD5_9BURK|nr:hypothetical protein CPter91_4728 [Collimonas pratensis]